MSPQHGPFVIADADEESFWALTASTRRRLGGDLNAGDFSNTANFIPLRAAPYAGCGYKGLISEASGREPDGTLVRRIRQFCVTLHSS